MRKVAAVVLTVGVIVATGFSIVPAQASTMTANEMQRAYRSANARASCLTDAQRNDIRVRVSKDYLDEAQRAYPAARRLNNHLMNYLPDAVAHYRWYLNAVLHAIVTGEGSGCNRTVVAFFPNARLGPDAPSVVFFTEEEFAQAQRGPVELSQGCCSNGYGGWGYGETGYGANLGGAGNGLCDSGCLGIIGNTFGWAGPTAWGAINIALGMALIGGVITQPLSSPLTLDDLVRLGTSLTLIGKGFADLANGIERASGGDHNGDK